jgi:protein-tyrosine phosphatase
MVDIHCHFLPGLDDGSPDWATTEKMLWLAAESGTTDLVATPHADTQYQYDPAQVEDLLAEARSKAPPGLALHRACDFHLMHDNLVDALANPDRYTVNGGRYLLVELSDLVIFGNTNDLFERLEAAGMTIIVTHPERNPLLRQRPELLREWVQAGRLLQVTASSLSGFWGRKAAGFSRLLLDQGLVHFVASDGHDANMRPPSLKDAHTWLERHYGAGRASALLEDHPLAVIEDRPIDFAASARSQAEARPAWWRRVWKRG